MSWISGPCGPPTTEPPTVVVCPARQGDDDAVALTVLPQGELMPTTVAMSIDQAAALRDALTEVLSQTVMY